MFMHCVYFKIKLYLFLFLTDATYTMNPNAMQLVPHNTQKSNTCNATHATHTTYSVVWVFGCIAARMTMCMSG